MSLEVDGIQPLNGVIKPTSVNELSSILFEYDTAGLGVIPFGGATRLEVGNTPKKFDIGIDTTALSKMVSHNPADLTCTVEAGMDIAKLQSILDEHGQFLAIDAPLPGQATVGGTIASLPPGYLRWQLGHPRDTVIGMEVLLANGTITKSGGQVVKNVSGYDMARLHVGGFGTLGVITKVSFKLTPSPRKEISLQMSFPDSVSAHEFGQSIYNSYMMPLSLACTSGGLVSSDINFSQESVCTIRLGGRERSCNRQVQIVTDLCSNYRVYDVQRYEDLESRTIWDQIRDCTLSSDGDFSIIGRISIIPSKMQELEKTLIEGWNNELGRISLISQPGYGTLIMLITGDQDSVNDEAGVKILKNIRQKVNSLDCSLTYERIPAEWKRLFNVWDTDYVDSMKQMDSLKKVYDPNDTLNSGRFIFN